MAYSSQLMTVATDAPVWLLILAATVNWLDSMKIGLAFGILFGAPTPWERILILGAGKNDHKLLREMIQTAPAAQPRQRC